MPFSPVDPNQKTASSLPSSAVPTQSQQWLQDLHKTIRQHQTMQTTPCNQYCKDPDNADVSKTMTQCILYCQAYSSYVQGCHDSV